MNNEGTLFHLMASRDPDSILVAHDLAIEMGCGLLAVDQSINNAIYALFVFEVGSIGNKDVRVSQVGLKEIYPSHNNNGTISCAGNDGFIKTKTGKWEESTSRRL